MVEFLTKYLSEKGGLTVLELDEVKKVSSLKQVRKNQLLLEEGNVCDFIGFVVKGSFRLFRRGKDG